MPHSNDANIISSNDAKRGSEKSVLAITCLVLGLVSVFFTGCRRSPDQVSKPNGAPTDSSVRLNEADEFDSIDLQKSALAIRFATFNISFHRNAEGELATELAQPGSPQASQIAEIIQRVRPDVILLNEFDFDAPESGLRGFQDNYLSVSQGGQTPITYPYRFTAPVNTGVDSGLDFNGDGKLASPDDAFGYGAFPGQYAMAVLSQYPIDADTVRTFQTFLWKDLPSPQWPIDPATHKDYYSDEIKQIFRLSSKSHWDVPIRIGDHSVHFLVSHPTPPVFDGPEDRNGCRNHDEIRFWTDYISGADYFYDDQGRRGGIKNESHFVIAGDLNADPVDGDGQREAIGHLLDHPAVNNSITPSSPGGVFSARGATDANSRHQGNPAHDTGNFNPSVGNLRVDYCLPSRSLKTIQGGVFWPLPSDEAAKLVEASDHRLVWVDLGFETNQNVDAQSKPAGKD